MASSNKAQDPAAAALLAIEEALNLRARAKAPSLAKHQQIPAGADKPKGRLPAEPETAVTASRAFTRRPRDSIRGRRSQRRPRSMRTVCWIRRGQIPPKARTSKSVEPTGDGPCHSLRPANDDRPSAGEILACLSEPATTGVRRSSSRPVRFCGSSCRSAILSPTAQSSSILRRGPCCRRRPSPS